MSGYWWVPELPELPDPTLESERSVPKILTRVFSHLTYKNYGQKLLKNLAPGAKTSELEKLGLPREARELLEWHDGYTRPWSNHVIVLPGEMRLLSVFEALAHHESKMDTAVDDDWWNEDIVSSACLDLGGAFLMHVWWPVMVAPDCQTFVIMSKSTGRAAYREDMTNLADEEDVCWFKSLYDLVRVVELSAAEGKLAEGVRYGEPYKLDEIVGDVPSDWEPEVFSDESDSDDEELQDEEEQKKGD